MDRDDLFKKFRIEKNLYQSEIEGKNANLYEDSYLFEIDIINVANDFDKATLEFESLANRMANITDDDMRFDDTIIKLQENAKKIKSKLTEINFYDISKFIREASENIVFVKYLEDFTKLNMESHSFIKRIEERFNTYDGLKSTLEMYKNHYDNAINEIDRKHYENQLSNTKDNLENCLIQINSQLDKLKANNLAMQEILNKGLRRRTK